MKVVHVKDGEQRNACLARLCAEVYGQRAGLKPLLVFVGARRVLFPQEGARLLALIDNIGSPLALALLVLDEAGEGMTLSLSCSLDGTCNPEQRLVSDLVLKAPLRVEAQTTAEEDFFRSCGISRWFAGEAGARIGLGGRHPATSVAELEATLEVDEKALLRRLKHDTKRFSEEKQCFVDSLEAFPHQLS
ncbi:hypothetical protein R5M92_10905 [Halomonas sp. Bachu 37]|uniref:hypothetical protein n=1 Tax=Halomonas kashgarensis TaxID=3084920 RepID=UPI0032166EA0